MKTCRICKVPKPLEQFPKRPKMKDGHRTECIECTRAAHLRRHHALMENSFYAERQRKVWRERAERARLLGTASPTNRNSVKRWQVKNRHKSRCHLAAHRAQRKGLLIKPKSCEGCGATDRPLEKHHPDYSKPLTVEWLCPKCHGITKRKPQLTSS